MRPRHPLPCPVCSFAARSRNLIVPLEETVHGKKTMGKLSFCIRKPWQEHGKTIGNDRKIMEKNFETIGQCWKMMEIDDLSQKKVI